MYSLALILFFIYCWWLFGGLGLAFPESLYCGGPLQRIGTVLSLGIATATIVATVGYFWGLSTLELCLGLSLVAGVSWLRVTVRLKNMRLPSDCYLPLFITLVGCLLALLPALVGGLQFSLFQGNHHDSFNYLESAITHARLSYQAVQQSDMLNIDNLGGFHYAHVNLLMRPSVVILYGTLCHFFSDYTLGNHYAFLVSLMSCAMVILAGLIQSLTPWLKSWQTLLLSGSVILGFWGQYIVDINAWSQVAWLPLFTYSVAFPLSQIPTPETASQSSTALRLWLPWWITLVAMVYMYPEAAAYSFVPLASLALFCLIKNGMRLKLVPFFFLGVIASIFFVPVYRSNIQFLVQQAGQATSSYDWWKYFQAFLGGRDGFVNGPFAGMADGIAGCLGLYYLTPDSNLQPALQAIWRISYFGILAIIFFATYQALRLTRREISLRWKAIVLLIGLLVVETVFLFWKRQYWSAGKGLSFFASIVLAMGLGALAQGTNDRWWNICKRALLFSLVISGLGMAGARVMGAGRHSGILYRPPYPSIQGDLLKTTFDYGDHTFLAKLGANDYVEIDIDNPWVEEFVHMELYIREIPFYLARPIRTNRYSEISIGQMTVQRAPTARLTVEVDSSRAVPSFVKLTRISPPAK